MEKQNNAVLTGDSLNNSDLINVHEYSVRKSFIDEEYNANVG